MKKKYSSVNAINSLLVQVVDNLSMKMVSACTKMHELSAEGITSKKITMRMRIRMSMRRIAIETYIELKTLDLPELRCIE